MPHHWTALVEPAAIPPLLRAQIRDQDLRVTCVRRPLPRTVVVLPVAAFLAWTSAMMLFSVISRPFTLWLPVMAVTASITGVLGLSLPFLFEYAKLRFRAHQFAEAVLEPNRITWKDAQGKTHPTRSVHTIKAIDTSQDLLSYLTWIEFDDQTTWAWRFEDHEQAIWWADLLEAWLATYRRQPDEHSERARRALDAVTTVSS